MEKRDIEVNIKGIEREFVSGKEKIFYMINIEYGGNEWEVQRRFSEFVELQKQLKFHFSNLPKLPSKTLFPISKADDIEKRRCKLEIYLKLIVQRDEVYANTRFASFLDIEKHASDTMLNQLTLAQKMTHKIFGFRDVLILQEHGYIFTLTSEMSAGTRVDSYLTNKFVKNTKDARGHVSSVGALECWKEEKGEEGIVYKKLWFRAFKSQAICLTYNPELNYLLVGCDNGDIVPVEIKLDDIENYNELRAYKIHLKRVMDSWIDGERSKAYSIGEDKLLLCFNFKTKRVLHKLKIGEKKLTAMRVHPESRTAFVATRGGEIHIVDLEEEPPILRQVVRIGKKASLRALEVNFEEGKLFTASYETGTIYYYKVPTPISSDSPLELIAQFQGPKKPRVMKYWASRNELYVGCAKGKMAIYQLDNVRRGPIYATRQHVGDITKMILLEKRNIICTAAKDKEMKFWIPPQSWRKDPLQGTKQSPKKKKKEVLKLQASDDDELKSEKSSKGSKSGSDSESSGSNSDSESGSGSGSSDEEGKKEPKVAKPPKKEKKNVFVEDDEEEDAGWE